MSTILLIKLTLETITTSQLAIRQIKIRTNQTYVTKIILKPTTIKRFR